MLIRNINKKDIHKNKETKNYNKVEELFFIKIKKGSRPYKLLSIYFPFDLMMIKSLFISEQIPYYVEFEHFMAVRPFIYCINYNNTNLYILEEDYGDAIMIINNYSGNRISKKYEIKTVIRNLVEMLVIAWIIPSPKNNTGMYIHYK
jgi:hypothetical protein